jgi:cell division protein FtsQ
MTRVAAPADKRFRRTRTRPLRRRGVWLRRTWRLARAVLMAGVIAYAGFAGVRLVLQASALRVSSIVITGNSHVSTGEVLAKLDGLRARNILLVDLDAARRTLLKSPWIAEAHLRRVLPGTLQVTLRERVPIGIGRLGRELYLVDGEGVIIDEYGPNYAHFDLPIIDGLSGAPEKNGLAVDPERAELAARVVRSVGLRADLVRRVSQIDVHDKQNVAVILAGDTAVLQIGSDQFLERLQSYVELAPALRARVPEIDYVDLRFDERVYVRPAAAETADSRIGEGAVEAGTKHLLKPMPPR